jgi:hypothetical protein
MLSAIIATVLYFNYKVLSFKSAAQKPRLLTLQIGIVSFFCILATLEPIAAYVIIAYLLVGEAVAKTWVALTKDLN